MQDEVNLNLAAEFWRAGVVRTDGQPRCDSIPALRAAVRNAASFDQYEELQINHILAGNLHVKHWGKRVVLLWRG